MCRHNHHLTQALTSQFFSFIMWWYFYQEKQNWCSVLQLEASEKPSMLTGGLAIANGKMSSSYIKCFIGPTLTVINHFGSGFQTLNYYYQPKSKWILGKSILYHKMGAQALCLHPIYSSFKKQRQFQMMLGYAWMAKIKTIVKHIPGQSIIKLPHPPFHANIW